MSSTVDNVVAESDTGARRPDTTLALIVYALLLGVFVTGLTPLIGVVIAYVYRGNGPRWLDEHYRYHIRTFWIGLLYAMISWVLAFVLVGFVLMALQAIWLIVRCVKGFKALQERRAPDNVDSWLW
ncbi:DUF4870 family protein [Salinicola avicenniae]|uniref:DUF4870 family protein n=1 Tax=Salinicola avicenniae TaxID=2916836 RepID=UPI002072EE4A|nr:MULTISPECIES: DUF4870 domain-containing protein [unclassified Salinicola]